jgi:hypothetical protein
MEAGDQLRALVAFTLKSAAVTSNVRLQRREEYGVRATATPWERAARILLLWKNSGIQGNPEGHKNAVFWAVAPHGFIINRRFGATCRLHLQGSRTIASEEKLEKLDGC